MPRSRTDPLVLWFLVGLGGSGFAEGEETWWSLQPLRRPLVPEARGPDAGRVKTPVDSFIVSKHRERGLRLSPEADRRILIRRLYFDVIGLPPSPAEVEAFVRDPDPEVYGKLVDKLLARPGYGERWARHWLDVVHYGESHGYDKDKPRPNSWPYRDYVIRAFNADRPYARFVKEQLAGDVLWPDTVDGIVATGFIASGPWDFNGHAEVPEEKIDGKVARHLDRDDMVTTTMNSFCSITVQCAQCHDHKLDPVTMKDYYSLQSVFAALDRADRPYDAGPELAARRAALTREKSALQEKLSETRKTLQALKTPEVVALEKEITELNAKLNMTPRKGAERSGRYGYHSTVAASRDTVKWVQIDLGKARLLDKIVLVGADEYGFADFGFPHRFRVESSNKADFSRSAHLADHSQADYPRPGGRPLVLDGKGSVARYVRVTATRLWSRRRKGQPESNDWIFALGEMAVISDKTIVRVEKVTALDSIEAAPRWAKADLVDGIYGAYPLGDLVVGKESTEGAAGDLLRLADAGSGELKAQLKTVTARREALMTSLARPELNEREKTLQKHLGRMETDLGKLSKPQMVYAGTVHKGSGTFKGRGHVGGKPRDIFILHRGDVTSPGDAVMPAAVPGIVPGRSPVFELPGDHREGDRRVALAEWITHPENTLTWRSIVNRVWHYHFGQGIVGTPNDFGRVGGRPSHPELLDWLAVEFREGGGSLKSLHRLILNSAVYRQVSVHDEQQHARDDSNRFLWRQNRRRIEAEALRDTVLLVSGKLDRRMEGPSFKDFVIEQPQHSPHYQYHKANHDDPATHRRSIYRFIIRSQPQPFMETLDCADPSQLVDKRGETTTALQALALLNNAFMVRMAEHFASHVEKDPDPIVRAVELTLSRKPTTEEHVLFKSFAGKHGLSAMCRLLFNFSEFSFVD